MNVPSGGPGGESCGRNAHRRSYSDQLGRQAGVGEVEPRVPHCLGVASREMSPCESTRSFDMVDGPPNSTQVGHTVDYGTRSYDE